NAYVKLFIIISGLIPALTLHASSDKLKKDVVARINTREVKVEEFQNRLNNLPMPMAGSGNELKENLLCTIAAETILSYEALSGKLDTVEIVKRYINEYENEALYEQWMSAEITSQVSISDDELREGYKKFREERYLEFWTFKSKGDALEFREAAMNGTAPILEAQTKKLNFGESLKEVEDAVYSLKEDGIAEPILVDSAYYVFKLVKKSLHPQHGTQNFVYWEPSVERIIRDRKERAIMNEKLSALMSGKSFVIQKDVYKYVLDRLYPIIYNRPPMRNDMAEIIQKDIQVNTPPDADMMSRPLVVFGDNSVWTAEEFWKRLSVSPYPLNYKDQRDLTPGVIDVIRKMVLAESITEDARKKSYDNLVYAKEQTEMWKSNLLAQALVEEYRKAINISRSDLIKYYESNQKDFIRPEQRKILPIIVKNKELAEKIYTEIQNGADMLELAKRYSMNKSFLNEKEPGIFIEKDYWGAAGKAAFAIKPGEISKPLALDDSSYAIVKVLEVKESGLYQFDEVSGQIASICEDKELQLKINELLLNVADKYEIEINREAFNSAAFLGGGLAVRKTHFPLRNASPGFLFFNHNAEWYKRALKGK
ncbi:MAG TPA: peptidylprolyl isomerase, partial [Ignavibacteriales bacterium]|nr:peptidylprolyl isomerase [Ignavibacteriales bacterium]